MHRFHIGLEAMLPGRNSAMHLAGNALDGLGEGRITLGLPGTDKFAAVVGLPGCLRQIHPAPLEMRDDALCEQVGITETQDVGISQEQQSRGDIPDGVLVERQAVGLHLIPIFRNITKDFGIRVDLLEQTPGFLDLSQTSFGLVFPSTVLAVEAVISADATDGFFRIRQLKVVFEPSGRPPRQTLL